MPLIQRKDRQYVIPDWPAPENIKAISTTRLGGVSLSPWDSFNFGENSKDNDQAILANRKLLIADWNMSAPCWLRLVHGGNCTELSREMSQQFIEADAAFTLEAGQVCAVTTADCLPILLCNTRGTKVAAIHAGWRGFIAGIIENTISKIEFSRGEGLAWLGPAISSTHFELGPEVYQQFIERYSFSDKYFIKKNQRYFLDMYGLARHILESFGITVYGGEFCTFEQEALFFSYRRDNITGRMASLIWFS